VGKNGGLYEKFRCIGMVVKSGIMDGGVRDSWRRRRHVKKTSSSWDLV